jgi:hypothetical protein
VSGSSVRTLVLAFPSTCRVGENAVKVGWRVCDNRDIRLNVIERCGLIGGESEVEVDNHIVLDHR